MVETVVGDAIMGCPPDMEMFMANELGTYAGGKMANPLADYINARPKVPTRSSQQIRQDSLAPHSADYLMASASGQGQGFSPDFLGPYPGHDDPDDLLNYLLNIQNTSNQPAVQTRTRSQLTQQMLKQQGNAARMQGIPIDYLKAMRAAEGFADAHPDMMQTAKETAIGFGVGMAADFIGIGVAAGVGSAVAPLQEAAVKFTNMATGVAVGGAFVASQFVGVGEVADILGGAAQSAIWGARALGIVRSERVANAAVREAGFFSRSARVEVETGAENVMSAPKVGDDVYRIWGDDSPAYGRSWTRTDPRAVEKYRDLAGLPADNTGRFFSEGRLKNVEGITQRSALPLNGNTGGLDELVIPDPQEQIELKRVLGINPEF